MLSIGSPDKAEVKNEIRRANDMLGLTRRTGLEGRQKAWLQNR